MTTWQDVQTHWTDFKPKVHGRWPKLSETELTTIAGKRDMLSNTLETDYRITHIEAEKQIDDFLKTLAPTKAKGK